MNKAALFFLSFSHFVNDLNLGSLPAVLPFFVASYGFDYKSIAGLMFAASCLSSVVQPLFGYLSDRTERVWFMGSGLILCGASFALCGLSSDYWTIFAAILVSGIGSAVFHPQAAKIVNGSSGKKRGTGISFFSVGGSAGFGLGPIIAVALISVWGMPSLIAYGILSVAVGVPLLVFGSRLAPAKEEKESVPGTDTVPESAARGRNNWRGFSRLTVFIVLRSAVYVGLSSFLPLFCIDALGADKATAALTISVISLGGVAFTFLGGPLSDRYGYVRMVRLGSLLLIPAIAFAVFPHSLFWVFAMLLPISLAFSITYSPFVVLGQTYLAKSVGFASGITLGISFSAGGILAPALGWFGDLYSITTTMTVLAVLAASAFVVSLFLPQPDGQEAVIRNKDGKQTG